MAAKMTWEEARDRLKKLRDGHQRRSEEVIDLWEGNLQLNRHQLADEVWPIFEQVCIAACDCGRDDIALECIKCLKSQFPGSARVGVLRGMFLESTGKFEEAQQLYEKIEENEPSNTVVRKRRIAMLKENNQMKEAISHLNKYLQDYMADVEAWGELCELYLSQHDYAKAAFCVEEMLLFSPNNPAFHCKYAEIKYTEGKQDSIEIARKYFAQALRMDRNNMRALFGFYLSATSLANTHSTNKVDNVRYAEWAAKEIQQRYQEAEKTSTGKKNTASPNVETINAMLAQMGVS